MLRTTVSTKQNKTKQNKHGFEISIVSFLTFIFPTSIFKIFNPVFYLLFTLKAKSISNFTFDHCNTYYGTIKNKNSECLLNHCISDYYWRIAIFLISVMTHTVFSSSSPVSVYVQRSLPASPWNNTIYLVYNWSL